MLAVLKAGGAFVPLDSTQPISRLESAIRQTNSGLALSSRECAQICRNVVDFVFIVNAESVAELGKGPAGPGALSPTTAAYVIFTSGSTGKPKGVVIEHEQLSTSSTKGGKLWALKQNHVFYNSLPTPSMPAFWRSSRH
jgi:non-ribosomal peptide synthetase component F